MDASELKALKGLLKDSFVAIKGTRRSQIKDDDDDDDGDDDGDDDDVDDDSDDEEDDEDEEDDDDDKEDGGRNDDNGSGDADRKRRGIRFLRKSRRLRRRR